MLEDGCVREHQRRMLWKPVPSGKSLNAVRGWDWMPKDNGPSVVPGPAAPVPPGSLLEMQIIGNWSMGLSHLDAPETIAEHFFKRKK